MKRSIIHIDEDKCNGCGLCVPACHEGAIKIIDGKARLAGDSLCDGLGACLGECPQGAITIEERDADQYNEIEALENIMKEGPASVEAHLKHLKEHGQTEYVDIAEQYLKEKRQNIMQDKKPSEGSACGCPGAAMRDLRQKPRTSEPGSMAAGPLQSELQQWPIQLRLLNPHAPFFQDADLLVCADCAPFTYADFHRKFLKGKVLVMFCPKLDEDLDGYVEKLTAIFKDNTIKSITIVRMEVPCCGGTERIVEEALKRSGKNIILRGYTISLQGEII
jgi:NAD-dependent dihydropyrimidine dehydrogenase PreA subunit/phosphohistidine swiveling domain-containing protein